MLKTGAASAITAARRSGKASARGLFTSLENRSQVKPEDEHPSTEVEHGKMVSEGGGSVSSFGEAKENVKNKSGGVVEGIKKQVEVEMNTARDMFKGVPEKTAETKEELKKTAVVAGQTLKRDIERLAEKAGIRDRKPGNLENE